MEQTTFPAHKSKPMRSFLSKNLITSTPASYQITKRIKGLKGFSEHYKGSRVDYPIVSSKFFPPRTRNYRKARELTVEIWDLMVQTNFLERFLKSQKSIQDIRIKVLTENPKRGTIKRLCEIFSKMEKLCRVHIDLDKEHLEQMRPELIKDIRCLRKLPRLKDVDITAKDKHIFPFSINLERMGFDSKHLQDTKAIQRLIDKASNFHHLDTIRTEFTPSDSFADGLAFIISKLPNFRELNLYSPKYSIPSRGQAVKILDALAEAPKFEILSLEGRSSLLKHPLFKAKSLKRTSFSLCFAGYWARSDNLNEVFDLLGEIPSLYELSLKFVEFHPKKFVEFYQTNEGISEDHLQKISRMTSLRKLRIEFDFTSLGLSEKQAGDVFRSVFNKMPFLEEVELYLPRKCLGLKAKEIQGLPRLKKATLGFRKSVFEKGGNPTCTNLLTNTLPKENSDLITKGEVGDMETIMEILAKCDQLRQLKLNAFDCVSEYPAMATKVSESLSKLKKLQVFRISTTGLKVSNMTMEALENLIMTCHKLRDLQDLVIEMWDITFYIRNARKIMNFYNQLRSNSKYRVIS